MTLSFPHRDAVVVHDHELHIVRRFATDGEIKVRAGERVSPDRVLGKSDPMAAAVRLDLARQLNIAPKDVAKHLRKPVGASFEAGEAVARVRRGFRRVAVPAPLTGIFGDFDAETGVVSIVPNGAGDVPAMVPGDIEYVDGRQAVVIRTVGHRLSGIVGVGGPARGPLRLAVATPDEVLAPHKVTAELNGAIVIAGAAPPAATLSKLAEVGAVAVIAGGVRERDLAQFLGWTDVDRMAPWRAPLTKPVLAADCGSPLAIVATEGFGPLPINPAAWQLLTESIGKTAVVLATTRLTHPLTRPEVIVPDEGGLDDEAQTSVAFLAAGATVRLVDHAHLGRVGRVASESRRDRIADGRMVEVVDVQLAGGGRVVAPVASLEVLTT